VKRWEAWINHWGWALTAVTGLAYGVLKYFVRGTDPNSRLPHPMAPPILAAHVLAAPVAVFALGLIFRRHAVAKLASDRPERRRTGSVLIYLAVPLILTGYVVQVLTGDAARQWTGWIHAGLGLVYAIGYLMHPLVFKGDAAEADADEEVSPGPQSPRGTGAPGG
jgi:hypothetical protein